jgi:hypothetical protein
MVNVIVSYPPQRNPVNEKLVARKLLNHAEETYGYDAEIIHSNAQLYTDKEDSLELTREILKNAKTEGVVAALFSYEDEDSKSPQRVAEWMQYRRAGIECITVDTRARIFIEDSCHENKERRRQVVQQCQEIWANPVIHPRDPLGGGQDEIDYLTGILKTIRQCDILLASSSIAENRVSRVVYRYFEYDTVISLFTPEELASLHRDITKRTDA